MALIPQSNDPGSLVGAGQRGTNDTLTQGFDGLAYLLGDAATITDGAGGNDHLSGSSVSGDAFQMFGSARGGNDALYGGDGFNTLLGDAVSSMSGTSRGGNDRLYGGDSGDSLIGDANSMFDAARGGNDRLYGGDGVNGLIGDAVGMSATSRGGNDRLYSGDGNDFLYGDGAQALTFDAAQVITAGNDRLVGGGGDDEMFGDFQEIGGPGTVRLGRDVFAFGAASGQDLVLDFQQGLDRLDVRGAGLTADEFATHVTDNVVDLEGGNGVTVTTLAGALVELAPGDFLFA